MGNRLPVQVHQCFLRLCCIMKAVIVMEELNIFTSRVFFLDSLSKFLELIGVSRSGDYSILSQQLPLQDTSCV